MKKDPKTTAVEDWKRLRAGTADELDTLLPAKRQLTTPRSTIACGKNSPHEKYKQSIPNAKGRPGHD